MSILFVHALYVEFDFLQTCTAIFSALTVSVDYTYGGVLWTAHQDWQSIEPNGSKNGRIPHKGFLAARYFNQESLYCL